METPSTLIGLDHLTSTIVHSTSGPGHLVTNNAFGIKVRKIKAKEPTSLHIAYVLHNVLFVYFCIFSFFTLFLFVYLVVRIS